VATRLIWSAAVFVGVLVVQGLSRNPGGVLCWEYSRVRRGIALYQYREGAVESPLGASPKEPLETDQGKSLFVDLCLNLFLYFSI
jgi:hypothetical protein